MGQLRCSSPHVERNEVRKAAAALNAGQGPPLWLGQDAGSGLRDDPRPPLHSPFSPPRPHLHQGTSELSWRWLLRTATSLLLAHALLGKSYVARDTAQVSNHLLP